MGLAESAVLVGMVVVLSIILYIVVRSWEETRRERHCPNCGTDTPDKDYCGNCGSVTRNNLRCGCGKYYNPSQYMDFCCPACRSKMDKSEC